MGLLGRLTRGILVLVLTATVGTGCQVVRLPVPIRALPGEWSIAGSNAGRNSFSPSDIAPPLQAEWNYGAIAAFGPSGPVVVSGHLLVGNRKGEVHAVRIQDGRKIGVANFRQPIEGNVVISGDRMFVTTAWGPKTVHAYDIGRGEKRWSVKGGPVDSSPVLVGSILVVATSDGSITGYESGSGAVVWALEREGAGITASLIADASGHVYVGDESGLVRSIRSSDGREAWRLRLAAPVYEAMTWMDDELYVPTTRGLLVRLDARTGIKTWSVDLGAPTIRFTPVTVAADQVYVGTTDGRVRAFGRVDGARIWETELDDGVSAQPLVTGDHLWVGTFGRDLVALDRATGARQWSIELPGRTKSTLTVHDGGILVLAEPRNVLYFKPTGKGNADH